MSFPVPTKYELTDDKNETVVVYNDGREENLLPDPGCFSQENINKFVDAWVSGYIAETAVITSRAERQYGATNLPFKNVLYLNKNSITANNAFNRILIGGNSIVFPYASLLASNMFYGGTFILADLGNPVQIGNSCFYSNLLLEKIILRPSTIVALLNVNAFTSTSYASGGSGGEIYIPQVLYDHLGDGSALDYKATENWSTIDGYGTITWRQIEGSEYEFNYADGTPIGSV